VRVPSMSSPCRCSCGCVWLWCCPGTWSRCRPWCGARRRRCCACGGPWRRWTGSGGARWTRRAGTAPGRSSASRAPCRSSGSWCWRCPRGPRTWRRPSGAPPPDKESHERALASAQAAVDAPRQEALRAKEECSRAMDRLAQAHQGSPQPGQPPAQDTQTAEGPAGSEEGAGHAADSSEIVAKALGPMAGAERQGYLSGVPSSGAGGHAAEPGWRWTEGPRGA